MVEKWIKNDDDGNYDDDDDYENDDRRSEHIQQPGEVYQKGSGVHFICMLPSTTVSLKEKKNIYKHTLRATNHYSNIADGLNILDQI